MGEVDTGMYIYVDRARLPSAVPMGLTFRWTPRTALLPTKPHRVFEALSHSSTPFPRVEETDALFGGFHPL